MMPSNAQKFFQVCVQIATFNFDSIQDGFDSALSSMGIERNEYIYSDNFEDFGFNTTDMIRNLQFLALVILFLLLVPLVLLLLHLAFFWSPKVKKCLQNVQRHVFWTWYIRILLETYLELSISALLRMQLLIFTNASEVLLSMISIMTVILIIAFMVGSLVLLQKYLHLLESDLMVQRYGELTVGLKR